MSLDAWVSVRKNRVVTENETTAVPTRTGALAVIDRLREGHRERREAREYARRVEQELASYTSLSDIDDLDAVLERYDDEDTELVRSILARQRRLVA